MKADRAILILFAILSVAFLAGTVHLFLLRFEAGDIYPPYSSLRADPLGTKAFFESLENLEGITARRNFRPLRLQWEAPLQKQAFPNRDSADTTTFYLGLDPDELMYLSEDALKAFEAVVANGGRLILSFFPVTQKPKPHKEEDQSSGEKGQKEDSEKTDKQKPAKSSHEDKQDPDNKSDCDEDATLVSMGEKWGFNLGYEESREKTGEDPPSARLQAQAMEYLPPQISWHTLLYFDKLDKVWQVVYTFKSHPVLIRRPLGRGTIILSSDSYLFSNEALQRERQPELLAWLMGPSIKALFDETHLGLREDPGIAALARKYRLHGLFAGILLLTGLFVWKNAVPFLPPYNGNSAQESHGHSMAKGYNEGFVSLLRRNIPPKDILTICLEEWKKSSGHAGSVSEEKIRQMEAIVEAEKVKPAKERNPVEAYRAMSKVLKRRWQGRNNSERE